MIPHDKTPNDSFPNRMTTNPLPLYVYDAGKAMQDMRKHLPARINVSGEFNIETGIVVDIANFALRKIESGGAHVLLAPEKAALAIMDMLATQILTRGSEAARLYTASAPRAHDLFNAQDGNLHHLERLHQTALHPLVEGLGIRPIGQSLYNLARCATVIANSLSAAIPRTTKPRTNAHFVLKAA